MRIYAPIQKVDAEQRLVYGYASTEALDSQGEVVSKAAVEAALPDYMQWGNIREMHQNSAVGVAQEATMDDKGLYLCAKVVDDVAWEKVVEGVYKGLSIGGKSLSKADGVVTSLRLTEISLVDRPANPECKFDVFKAEAEPPSLLRKWFGEQAWDGARAMTILNDLYTLLWDEAAEAENMPDQIKALKEAIGAVKAFIVSEMGEPDGEVYVTEPVTLAAGADNDLTKAGARHSKTDAAHLDAIHKALVELGYQCDSTAAKADAPADLAKVQDDLTKAEQARDAAVADLAKAQAERDDLQKQVDELKAQPEAPKVIAKQPPAAMTKAEDGGGEPEKEIDPSDHVGLMKKAQQTPMPFGWR